MSAPRWVRWEWSTLAAGAAALVVCAAGLLAVAQPILSDDLWWHLALGARYAEAGPWLGADPVLHTAVSAPAPAAWGADLALHAIEVALGFQGLRVFHGLLVLGLLAGLAGLLRRSGAPPAATAAGLAIFVTLALYRLVQLRPHLATIALTGVLAGLLLLREAPPSWRRVTAAAAVIGLWAQLHSAFLLGPLLIAAVIASLGAASFLRPADRAAADRRRAGRLAVALAAGLALSALHPMGFAHHLAFFTAGAETPALGVVTDEWAPVRAFAWPVANLPPSPLSWALLWALGVATLAAALASLRAWWAGRPGLDPAYLGLAAAGFVALLTAVRFVWLATFAVLLLVHACRAAELPPRLVRRVAGGLAVLLALAFFPLGPWPMVSRGVETGLDALRSPYRPSKYHAHAVWMLKDSGLEGRLYNTYWMGNFLGYWLAPELRAFVNGSLNLPIPALEASRRLEARRGRDGGSFEALLDEYGVDVFLGIGAPDLPAPNRPDAWTTGHLEGAEGWRPVFRNLWSSVWLRDAERNRENWERVRRYYAERGVPFDPERGFEPGAVLHERPDWALRNGLVPIHWQDLLSRSRSFDPETRRGARRELALLHAVLGLYEEAVSLDRRLLRFAPDDAAARRRLVWCLLQLDRNAEALQEAERLPVEEGTLSQLLLEKAAELAATPSAAERAAIRAALPLLAPEEVARLAALVPAPIARPARHH